MNDDLTAMYQHIAVILFFGYPTLTEIMIYPPRSLNIAHKYHYMISISKLGEMEITAQKIHELALSHIIATDFDSMLEIVDEIRDTESQLTEQLEAYKPYLSDENAENYNMPCTGADDLNYYIADLMAYSAAGDKEKAFACANMMTSDR